MFGAQPEFRLPLQRTQPFIADFDLFRRPSGYGFLAQFGQRHIRFIGLKPLIQPQREAHLGFHAAFVAQPDMPAVIDENGSGDLRRVEGREVFDLLEDFAQCGVRRLVLAGLPDHFRRNFVNSMNHRPQDMRLTARLPAIVFYLQQSNLTTQNEGEAKEEFWLHDYHLTNGPKIIM